MGQISLEELKKRIQAFHSLDDLERFLDEIFDHPDATDADKRLKQGPYAQVFKLAGEELLPLICWLKLFAPDAEGRVIDGTQNYDAEVRVQGNGSITRLEIGRAIDGYSDRLLSEAITKDGHGSPFSTYERTGKGKDKTVQTTNPRITGSANSRVDSILDNLGKIAAQKSGKAYGRDTIMVLFVEDDIGVRGQNLERLRSQALCLIKKFGWPTDRVDVISKSNEILASYRQDSP